MKLAELFGELLENLAQRFSFGGHQLRHRQAGEDAVFFRHVTFDTESAGFFAAHDDGLAFHQCADVFEADRRFVDFHTEHVRHGVHLMTRRHGPHDRARPAAVLLQVIQGQREDLIRCQPGAVLVHDAETVGVAVQAQAELRLAAANEFADLGHAVCVRLGMMPAEERVQFVVEDGDFRAGFFQQRVEVAAARAIHEFDGNFELRLLDGCEVHEFVDLFEVGGLRIERLALIRADDRAFESPVAIHQLGAVLFDAFGDFRISRCAVAGGEFEALIFGGIVARGHIDAADGFSRADVVRDDGRGRVAIAEQGIEAVAGENLGDRQRKLFAQEARVATNDDDGWTFEEW